MKKIFIFCFSFILMIGLTACGGNNSTSTESNGNSNSSEPVPISIGTAGLSTPTYTYGNGMANVWNDLLGDKVKVSAVETAGGPKNVSLMRDGEVQIGQVVGADSSDAYNGTGGFKDAGEYKDLRIFALMFNAGGHWIATESSGIESLSDFEGKKIAPGPSGSSKEKLARDVLGVFGLDYLDKKNLSASFIADSEVSTQLGNKQIDLAFITGQPPAGRIIETLSTGDNKLISMTEDEIQEVLNSLKGVNEVIIPAGTYPKQDKEIKTIGAPVMWVIDKNVDDELVYELTKTYVENSKEIGLPDAMTKDELLKFAKTDWGLPIHAGAAKYYEEQGVEVPNK